MDFSIDNRKSALNGLFFVILFAVTAKYLAASPIFQNLGISPLIIGILIGMIYGNTLRDELPTQWVPGVLFSTRLLLRMGIILYGFRITVQDVFAVGSAGLAVSFIIVATTFTLGSYVGMRFFKLDLHTALLTAVGTAICGAAAILATEPVIKSKPHKSAIAVSTVVLFGTLSMFLYPALYTAGFFSANPTEFGIYIGGTIHEVAHVVAAGNAISPIIADTSIIVKMIRVMMIAPLLILLSIWLGYRTENQSKDKGKKVIVPWFALAFIAVIMINSFNIIPIPVVTFCNELALFFLTMAMCALGMETNLNKFKGVGLKPFYLAFVLFLWVTCGGYAITKAMTLVF